jgi:hypothetical protein
LDLFPTRLCTPRTCAQLASIHVVSSFRSAAIHSVLSLSCHDDDDDDRRARSVHDRTMHLSPFAQLTTVRHQFVSGLILRAVLNPNNQSFKHVSVPLSNTDKETVTIAAMISFENSALFSSLRFVVFNLSLRSSSCPIYSYSAMMLFIMTHDLSSAIFMAAFLARRVRRRQERWRLLLQSHDLASSTSMVSSAPDTTDVYWYVSIISLNYFKLKVCERSILSEKMSPGPTQSLSHG